MQCIVFHLDAADRVSYTPLITVIERLRHACVAGLLCTVSLATLVSAAQLPAQLKEADWARADASISRLDPRTFKGVPMAIRSALAKRGCTIPQPTGSQRARNIVSGHFTQTMRMEWAVLCSRNQRSKILVFRGKDLVQVDELAEAADADYLEADGDGRIEFSRGLATVSSRIIRRVQSSEPAPLRIINHDGIDDAFEGKGSTIWYWFEGTWISLQGSD